MEARTVLNRTLADLLQHLGPHLLVALLVLFHALGLQFHDLRNPFALVLHLDGCGGDMSGSGGGGRVGLEVGWSGPHCEIWRW